MLELRVVRAVAEGFVFGQSTATKTKGSSALKSVGIALWVYNFEFALNFERSIVIYCNFRCCHDVAFNFFAKVEIMLCSGITPYFKSSKQR